jgi:Protein of unknown function (DUF3604)
MEHDLVKSGTEGALKAYENWMGQNAKREDPLAEMTELKKTMWERETEAAEKYNQPGLFTAFIGFEWTSMPNGNNLHRNVIFRDGKLEPSADPVRFDEVIAGRPAPKGHQIYARMIGASGLAAVWARENTREALWDAMARKEVFATTGTRMRVRVFGGWDFTEDDLVRSEFAKYGYDNGVPMGGDLKEAPEGKVPTLLIRALRDPEGANLDRVQVIKGWTDASGETQEKVYDIAWSGDRKPDANGKLPPVGNTVNVEEATYDNSIGAPFLQAYWKDSDFDPSQRAFYYVRVLEIPTPLDHL